MYKDHISSIIDKAYETITNVITNVMHLHPIETGRISEHLYAIKTGTVNFFIYRNAEDIICIDAGFGRSKIIHELNDLGIDPGSITHLFLTHSDFDHTSGSVLFEKAQVYLSSEEEPLTAGKKARMLGLIYNPPIKRTYHLLADNDVVIIGAIKIRAIATPGHTSGSMSYLVDDALLFVGDTFKLINNKVQPKRRYINMDTEQQKESIRKLACLDNIQLVFTAHNGYTEEFQKAIRGWKEVIHK